MKFTYYRTNDRYTFRFIGDSLVDIIRYNNDGYYGAFYSIENNKLVLKIFCTNFYVYFCLDINTLNSFPMPLSDYPYIVTNKLSLL